MEHCKSEAIVIGLDDLRYTHGGCAADDDGDTKEAKEEKLSHFKWPSLHLLDSKNASLYQIICVPLYNAALNGDWDTAKAIFANNGDEILRSAITEGYETALHVAAGAGQLSFVKALLKLMTIDDLALQDRNGNTAFCLAVATGNVPMATTLVRMRPDLRTIRGGANMAPLYMAAVFGHHRMAWFVYWKADNQMHKLEPEDGRDIFFRCIDSGLFNLALQLLTRYSELAMERNHNEETALHVLARKPSAFSAKAPGLMTRLIHLCRGSSKDTTIFMQKSAVELVISIWKNMLSKGRSDAKQMINYPFRLLFEAARLGNSGFLTEILRFYPDFIWQVDDNNQTIFHAAVLQRQESIFNLIYRIGSIKDVMVTYENEYGDNILHMAAKLPSSDRLNAVSGSVLQMQRELLWFKEVESLMQTSGKEKRGSRGLTPRELFSKEHKTLLKDGEKWTKNVAQSCMMVAMLVFAVVFVTSFGIKSGSNDYNQPKDNIVRIFAVFNVVALSSSIVSTLIFLSILTSRFAEDDFCKSLPLKLVAGVATLFITMMAMTVAFCAASVSLSHDRHVRVMVGSSSDFCSFLIFHATWYDLT